MISRREQGPSRRATRYWQRNDTSSIRPDWLKRVRLILSRLDAAQTPEEMRVPGLDFHPLKGGRAVSVSGNWRITVQLVGEDATRVDLEDYHG